MSNPCDHTGVSIAVSGICPRCLAFVDYCSMHWKALLLLGEENAPDLVERLRQQILKQHEANDELRRHLSLVEAEQYRLSFELAARGLIEPLRRPLPPSFGEELWAAVWMEAVTNRTDLAWALEAVVARPTYRLELKRYDFDSREGCETVAMLIGDEESVRLETEDPWLRAAWERMERDGVTMVSGTVGRFGIREPWSETLPLSRATVGWAIQALWDVHDIVPDYPLDDLNIHEEIEREERAGTGDWPGAAARRLANREV